VAAWSVVVVMLGVGVLAVSGWTGFCACVAGAVFDGCAAANAGSEMAATLARVTNFNRMVALQ
jgi:uncharacterized membrane protein (DUF2068 family)